MVEILIEGLDGQLKHYFLTLAWLCKLRGGGNFLGIIKIKSKK
jgi:hypothetical protein